MSGTALTAHIRSMLITDLLSAYAHWLFASAMFIWLTSVLYRTTRDTVSAYAAEDTASVAPRAAVLLPARPDRDPRVHLTAAA